jgi:hypothetical protein
MNPLQKQSPSKIYIVGTCKDSVEYVKNILLAHYQHELSELIEILLLEQPTEVPGNMEQQNAMILLVLTAYDTDALFFPKFKPWLDTFNHNNNNKEDCSFLVIINPIKNAERQWQDFSQRILDLSDKQPELLELYEKGQLLVTLQANFEQVLFKKMNLSGMLFSCVSFI